MLGLLWDGAPSDATKNFSLLAARPRRLDVYLFSFKITLS